MSSFNHTSEAERQQYSSVITHSSSFEDGYDIDMASPSQSSPIGGGSGSGSAQLTKSGPSDSVSQVRTYGFHPNFAEP